MKSYSLELVQRKTGNGMSGKLAAAALLGAGVYWGYKKLKNSNKDDMTPDEHKGFSYDPEAHEGDDFTARVLKAAKRIIK